jgi:hypothetical protein
VKGARKEAGWGSFEEAGGAGRLRLSPKGATCARLYKEWSRIIEFPFHRNDQIHTEI